MPLTPEAVLTYVTDRAKVCRKSVLGRSNFRLHTGPRAVVFTVLHDGGMSYPEIGRAFGRDHTTIMSAKKHLAASACAELQALLADAQAAFLTPNA